MSDVIQKVLDMQVRAMTRTKTRPQPQSATAQAQLMLWPKTMRGLPNPLARCALFTSSGKNDARVTFAKKEIVVSVENYNIGYKGEELRQDDLDVFLQLVHLARMLPLGSQVEVTGHSILQALNWGRSAPNYARLKQCIARLVDGTVTFEYSDGRQEGGFVGHLINSVQWEGEKDAPERTRWKVQIASAMVNLFGQNTFSLIDWEQRLALTSLAKWLHSFYFTHREPMPYSVELLHRLCGSKTKQLPKFRYKLKEALEELVSVGFLTGWTIDPHTDLANVKRKVRPSVQ
jgi:TrfA protein